MVLLIESGVIQASAVIQPAPSVGFIGPFYRNPERLLSRDNYKQIANHRRKRECVGVFGYLVMAARTNATDHAQGEAGEKRG
jgi:hypothetical protein